jgi:arsenate reductase-like glutaredoxin family protein
MFKKLKLNNINDYFKPLYEREEEGVYFTRITNYGSKTKSFLKKYLQELKNNGAYINYKLKPPTRDQIVYFKDISKYQFEQNIDFFININSKLFPQIDTSRSRIISEAIYDILNDMKIAGKNKKKIERFYIAIMCWLYCDFKEIIKPINPSKIKKILYDGNISKNKLDLMRIFSKIGCDIAIFLIDGDSEYLKLDPKSEISDLIFCDKPRKNSQQIASREPRYVLKYKEKLDEIIKNIKIPYRFDTNEWIKTDVFSSALMKHDERGNDDNIFYNMFVQINGVEDADTYNKKLIDWKLELDIASKKVIIINKQILPLKEHVAQMMDLLPNGNDYELVFSLAQSISFEKSPKIEKMIKKAYLELMKQELKSPAYTPRNRLLCIFDWINRFLPFLFVDRSLQNYPVFICYNLKIGYEENIFLRFLSKLPIDVFILFPKLPIDSNIKTNSLLKIKYDNFILSDTFPMNKDEIQIVSTWQHSEYTLEDTIYKDTNLYKYYLYNHIFIGAVPIILDIDAKKVYNLWDQKSTSRPNFRTFKNKIIIPITCTKFIGVYSDDVDFYWGKIKRLFSNNSMLLTDFPYIKNEYLSIDTNLISSFINGGDIQKEKILSHPSYKYSFIRKEMQEHMLNSLQELLDSRTIKDTFENGTEYKIIDVALNLNATFLNLINDYNFTGKIPKLICIDTVERVWSLEDSILIAYIRQLGFDIAFFSPAGHENTELYLEKEFFVEHIIGKYMDNLTIPNFKFIKIQDEKGSVIKEFLRLLKI